MTKKGEESMSVTVRRYDHWIKKITDYLKEKETHMTVIIERGNIISRTTSVVFVFATASCSCHNPYGGIAPEKQGIPNKPLETVVQNIQEHREGEDKIGCNAQKKFQVYVTPLPDETGEKNDEGLITLKGDV